MSGSLDPDLTPEYNTDETRQLWRRNRAALVAHAFGGSFEEGYTEEWDSQLGRALSFADSCYIDADAETITFAFNTED